jgi:all-beta uncharacterized protein
MSRRIALRTAFFASLVPAVVQVGCGGDSPRSVTQPSCTYTASPASLSIPAAGGQASVTIAAPAGCSWTAAINDATWLTIPGSSSGTGTGTVTVVATANNSTTPRAASLVVADQRVPVNQNSAEGGAPASMSGTAVEFTSRGLRGPVPNLRLKVRSASRFDGAVGGIDLPDIVTDANGRYEINSTSLILFVSTPPESDYRFLCDFYPLEPGFATRYPMTPALRDLPLVHVSWAGTELPPGMWNRSTSVHGTVSQRANGTLQPLAGATVMLDSGIQDPPATTTATGFFQVCSVVGTDQLRTITARKDGYSPVTKQIFGGYDFRVDFELALGLARH